ncbi:DNA polymerase III subunit delta [Algiphilus sp.]|uniref:DNA polymerase III subunit delta n=1 Tax=Algiphilus sp. TaxID=1872431 RepID=UPI0025C5DDD1|nr:DNA polymerase III subunit delta [Algiphilus sp.]MCK5770453.1 DNA polymerase III subunit delta [Algiphilus sp.]
MPIRPDQLDRVLASDARLWVVAGEEPLVIEESVDRVRGALRERGFATREQMQADGRFDWDALHAACASPSLFAEQRILELRVDGLDAKAATALQEAFDNAGSDTAILVIAGAIDGRARKTKWYTALEAAAQLVYAWPVRDDEMPSWIEARLRQRGVRAQRESVAAIAACAEGHLLAAAQIVDQLCALHGADAEPLDAEAVWALGADMARFDPFSLMDRVFAGDAAGALRAARALRRAGTELPAITGGLAFVLRQWHGAQRAFARSGDTRAAAQSARVFGPRARHLERALQRTRPGHVQALLRWLSEIDTAAKQGAATAAWDDLLTWTSVASGAVSPGFLPKAIWKN